MANLKSQFGEKMLNDRTLGAVCAFELEGKSDYLNPISKKIKAFSLARGVMIRPLGNTVYVAPPYTIKETSLDKIFKVIEEIILNV